MIQYVTRRVYFLYLSICVCCARAYGSTALVLGHCSQSNFNIFPFYILWKLFHSQFHFPFYIFESSDKHLFINYSPHKITSNKYNMSSLLSRQNCIVNLIPVSLFNYHDQQQGLDTKLVTSAYSRCHSIISRNIITVIVTTLHSKNISGLVDMCGKIAILVYLSPLKKEGQVVLHLPPENGCQVTLVFILFTCVTK